ncbi:MAG: hypothetical protein A2283_09895 [Lentisphaerae bacterium RIFOXYA12_FULL_48_11]|nr:MAG: hypothetical protein A2259_01860 [Candidatus Moranbacteria bacterium RIFOXYA2_FULL_43_15]OGV69211.1 MAG: hypothetical protein A2283_09895 [Lentisphaerae bacterium RIFOXYA12_FULL_48_11]
MNKKKIFIGLIATLVLLAGFGISKTFAAQDSSNNGFGMGMMRNFDSDDFQKMSQAHNLMAQGNFDEARKIMQDLGMGNCPMLNGNGNGMMGNWGNSNGNSGNNNGNFGGMMGGNGRGMMGNF